MEVRTEPPDSNVNQTIHPSHPENSQFVIIAGVQTVNTRHLNKLVGMAWCWLFQEGSSANAWEGSCTQSYVSRLFSCGCSQLSSGVFTFCITMSYLKCQVRQVLLSESFQGQVLGICNQFWLLADDFQAGPAMCMLKQEWHDDAFPSVCLYVCLLSSASQILLWWIIP